MTKHLLAIAAIYLAAIGLALTFIPLHFGRGAIPADASPQLLALARLLGGPFLGVAALNWMSRNADPALLRPTIWANVVGFGAVAANDLWGVASGEAREIARYFLVVHAAFALGFLALAIRTRRRAN